MRAFGKKRTKEVKEVSKWLKFLKLFFSNKKKRVRGGTRQFSSMRAHEERMKARRRKTKFHKW